MINKVILVGNLGKDPEVRHLESGNKVATYSIATNENYKDKAGEWQTITQWHNIVAWRGGAEIAERRLSKGSLVYIEGKLTHRQYQDKENNTRYITEVVANITKPLEKREGGDSGSFGAPLPKEEPGSMSSSGSATSSSTPKADDFDEDDLPF
ncbi:UNVERIFIED_CONTAM: hypothetical protein GTU68_041770 [Idotea baltica]|nr:hypothetical protein [Idotea baltica]